MMSVFTFKMQIILRLVLDFVQKSIKWIFIEPITFFKRSLFVPGTFEKREVTLFTGHGKTIGIQLVGTLRLILTDDDGVDWTYEVPDVVFDPKGNFNILGIPFLSKFFKGLAR